MVINIIVEIIFHAGVFAQRVDTFLDWLKRRPETCIGIVSHHGLLLELTGYEFDNCELCSFVLDLSENGNENRSPMRHLESK